MRAISEPLGIAATPDGTLWFTNPGNDSIGRLDADGMLDRFAAAGVKRPWGITIGPDRAVWFTSRGSNAIGRITRDGEIRVFRAASISEPVGITAGPDGAVWFTNYGNDTIGRITNDGTVSSFRGAGIRLPIGITAGPDGAVWFASNAGNAIGRLTTDGRLRLFKRAAISRPRDITLGPDGALWFTNQGALLHPGLHKNPVGRITTTGAVRSYPVRGLRGAFAITPGPGKALWFTSAKARTIGQITSRGEVATHTVETAPLGITLAADGALWFTSPDADSIRRITTGGAVRSYTDPSTTSPSSALTRGITVGPDGALWFTNWGGDSIGRITTAGAISSYTGPGIDSPWSITAGPDGALWFTAEDSIGRISTTRRRQRYADPSMNGPESTITAGPDGALWFTNPAANSIGRITHQRRHPQLHRPQDPVSRRDRGWSRRRPLVHQLGRTVRSGGSPRAAPSAATPTRHQPDSRGITAGPDGALWFTNRDNDSIGRITTSGAITQLHPRRASTFLWESRPARRRPLVHQLGSGGFDRADHHQRRDQQLHRPQDFPTGRSQRGPTAPCGSPTEIRSGGSAPAAPSASTTSPRHTPPTPPSPRLRRSNLFRPIRRAIDSVHTSSLASQPRARIQCDLNPRVRERATSWRSTDRRRYSARLSCLGDLAGNAGEGVLEQRRHPARPMAHPRSTMAGS